MEYSVVYEPDGDEDPGFLDIFHCEADDAEHAIEQCANAYPGCFIHEAFPSEPQDSPDE